MRIPNVVVGVRVGPVEFQLYQSLFRAVRGTGFGVAGSDRKMQVV